MSGKGKWKGREAMVIKIVETQFVETDAMTFKSVVQSLTGRESNTKSMVAMSNSSCISSLEVRMHEGGGGVEVEGSCGLRQGSMQLEDFERVFLELPPLDELVFWF